MAFDTPARIAIIGAGPIGLEVALYARFLGYQTDIYEQGSDVCEHVRRWQHVQLFTPFALNRSTLGLAALAAQDEGFVPPNEKDIISGKEWIELYLRPLSQTDLLVDNLQFNSRVISISRVDCLKNELVGDESRAENGFSILFDSPDGQQVRDADIVIDTSGVFSQPNYLGPGGAPAIGEVQLREQMVELSQSGSVFSYEIPDLNEAEAAKYTNRSTLLIGSGYSAATTVCQLAELAAENGDTSVTWFCRKPAESKRPVTEIERDSLSQRSSLARQANDLAANGAVNQDGWLRFQDEVAIREISYDNVKEKFTLRFTDGGAQESEQEFDNVIANVGYRPNTEMFRELQVHQCYATEGPMALAAKLMVKTSADCLSQTSHGAQTLVTTEPNFYVLGAKSYGRNSNFLYSVGLQQIRELFSLIGERENLDLYATSVNLAKNSSS